MKVKAESRVDIMCQDVPKEDGSEKGIGQPGKGCDGKPRKRKRKNQ
jgi:hypothetical protein